MAEARSAQTASEQPAAAGITRPRPGGLDGLVAGVAVAQVVSWGVLYYAFSVLLVPMQQDLGWSRTILIGGFTLAVVVSGLFAPAVGRHLDQGSARLVMSGGSVAGAALVALWSQARTVPTYYAVWVAIGVVMALVLYEPAFTVVAKRYAPRHHRPLTAVTLIGGTASLAFQPLTSALASEHGWRGALVILAVILAAVTIPVHLGVLPASTLGESRPHGRRTSQSRPVIDRRFLALTAAFAGASVTSFGASVLLVAYLVDHGWTLGRAAFASGVLGVMQLPGRLLFAPLHHHLSARTLTRLMLGLPGMGVVLLLASGGGALVWAAIPVLGMTQGVNTLLRVTLLVDLYGTARFGALNGRSATPVVLARALAPLGAAFLAAASGGYAVPFLLLAGVAAWASHLGGALLYPFTDCSVARDRRLVPECSSMQTDTDGRALTRLRAVADPMRWRILELLSAEELCVCHLVETLGVTQSLVSHHLKTLRDAGLVTTERYRYWTYYRISPSALTALGEELVGLARAAPPIGEERRPCC